MTCTRCRVDRPDECFGWVSKIRKGEKRRYRDSWCGDCRIVYKRLASQRLKANQARRKRLAESAEARERKRQIDKAYYERRKGERVDGPHERGAGWLDNRLKRKYGLSLAGYLALSESQGAKCAICGRHERSKARRLAVDHDHETGTVRALLCHHCNTGLGNFEDRIDLLESAIQYLRNHARKALA